MSASEVAEASARILKVEAKIEGLEEKIEGREQSYPASVRPAEVTVELEQLHKRVNVLQEELVELRKCKNILLTKAVLVTLKKGRATATHRFYDTPTWQQLCQAVEESFSEFKVEDFQLKDGDILLKESNWLECARTSQSITLQVLSSAVAFSSYTEDSLHTLLETNGVVDEDDAAFPYADYNQDALLQPGLAAALSVSKHGELMDLVGKELAMRVYTGDPQRHKES